jgi:drug/metabolite transporter (DMT)-like permease
VDEGTRRWRDGWGGILFVLALKVVGAFLLWLLFFHDELDSWWAWLSLALIVITAIAYVIAYASYRSSDVGDGAPTT